MGRWAWMVVASATVLATAGMARGAVDMDPVHIPIVVDGQALPAQVEPVNIDGHLLLPLRQVATALGLQVDWEPQQQGITLTRPGLIVQMHVGSSVATINGRENSLTTPPHMVDGHTLVPLRFLAEASGADVQWDADNRMVWVAGSASGGSANQAEQSALKFFPGASGWLGQRVYILAADATGVAGAPAPEQAGYVVALTADEFGIGKSISVATDTGVSQQLAYYGPDVAPPLLFGAQLVAAQRDVGQTLWTSTYAWHATVIDGSGAPCTVPNQTRVTIDTVRPYSAAAPLQVGMTLPDGHRCYAAFRGERDWGTLAWKAFGGQPESAYPAIGQPEWALIRVGKVAVGMSADGVRLAWGEPLKRNVQTTAAGTTEQWVYGQGQYVYVSGGVCTAVQQLQ